MRVLLAILSCRGYEVRRDAQRETWIKDIREWGGLQVDYRFFTGGKRSPVDFSEHSIVCECDDSYEALPQKVRSATEWALSAGYDYLFKCDDDTYVRPNRLLASGFEQHGYSGFIEDRNCQQKAYPFPVYPHAAGGPGYWLSRRSMTVVIAGLPNITQEDFAVGEALAKAGIQAFHDERYVQIAEFPRESVRPDFISLHKCGPAEMRTMHEHFQVLLQA